MVTVIIGLAIILGGFALIGIAISGLDVLKRGRDGRQDVIVLADSRVENEFGEGPPNTGT